LSRRQLLALLLAGALLQILALPLPGTVDVESFKIWSYHASAEGVAGAYGTAAPRADRRLSFNGHEQVLDYPPAGVAALGVVGRIYRAFFPAFPDDEKLTIAIKLLPLTASAVLTLVLLATPGLDTRRAREGAALLYWLNPAVMLNVAILGYLDALCALPAVGAVIAAASNAGWIAGALFALACLIKPQGVLVLPAIALALWERRETRMRELARAAGAGAAVAALFFAPIVRAGATANAVWAVKRLVTDHMLSGNATNVWWIAGAALHRPAQIVLVVNASYWLLLAATWIVVLSAIAWAVRATRGRGDLAALAALSAFAVHAYAVLALQVHENHLFLALPLLAIVAASRPDYRGLLLLVSLVAAVNANLFYGFGDGIGYALPRHVAFFDTSVVLALVNCVSLVWHAALLRRAPAIEPALAA